MNKPKFRFYALWLSLICILMFILQRTVPGFQVYFRLTPNALTMPWQFVTAIFLHGSVSHLVYNLFALLLFGLILEKLIGSVKFLIVFFVSGILANVISWNFYPNALGASGSIMGVIGAAAAIKPLMMMWAFGLILPMFVIAIIWVIGSIIGIFGFGAQDIGYLAHLSGIMIGIIYGLYLKLTTKIGVKKEILFQRKVRIPEQTMRNWEDVYLSK